MTNKKVFKLTTKKIDKSSRYIIAKGDGLKLPIAEYGGERKYYASPGSRLRDKIKKFWYIRWDAKNLSRIFSTEIKTSSSAARAYSRTARQADLTHESDLIRHVPVAEWVRDLNDLSKRLKVNIRFE